MKKLLFLLLVSGSAIASPESICERDYMPGTQYFKDCVQQQYARQQAQQNQPAYVPPIRVQPMPTNIFQTPNLPTNQPTTTNCRRMLDGSVSCTTY